MSLNALIKEHEELTRVLRERKKGALRQEFKEQNKELQGYKRKLRLDGKPEYIKEDRKVIRYKAK